MPWLQLRINSSQDQAAQIEDAVLAAGAVSVTLQDNADQPILEPALGETPLWSETCVTGLFDAATDTDQATVIATAHYGRSLPNFRWEILEDKDWERTWMDNYQPMQFGDRLWICPSWCQPPDPNASNLMLDPGLAFGTGTHPTTALCLQWLDGLPLAGKTVIDYGCGSGILGIAALLLGAETLIAVDNDPQALTATRENAKRNRMDHRQIHCCLPEQTPSDIKADIVVANILAGPLTELAATLAGLCKPGGQLALSGILSSQAKPLQAHYAQWFDMNEQTSLDDWSRLTGIRRSETR